jgi:pyridoxamine 5'-phosphate oxidase
MLQSALDPLDRFLEDRLLARAAGERWDAAACVLATADAEGHPSARFVLVKEADVEGFWFYTNYTSRKAEQLAVQAHAALAFHFDTVGVQYRIEGEVERAPDARSDQYFAARPRESQLGAWASEQSQPLSDARVLTDRLEALAARFPGAVPRPPGWGGFVLRARRIERWTEGAFRIHVRELYTRASIDDRWSFQHLQP